MLGLGPLSLVLRGSTEVQSVVRKQRLVTPPLDRGLPLTEMIQAPERPQGLSSRFADLEADRERPGG